MAGSRKRQAEAISDSDDEQDEEDGYSSLEDEEAALAMIQADKAGSKATKKDEREAIYNTEGLHDKLEEIAWTDEVQWVETQTIVTGETEPLEDVEDDLKRELAFYNQALDAAKSAVAKFDGSDIKWRRQDDYYAEMVKSDEHMLRVKEQLNFETQKIEAAEERRKQRESKRFQKQLQAERNKEKAQDKKRSIDEVSKWRKQRDKSGYKDDVEFDINNMGRKPKRAGERIGGGFAQKGQKRQYKDSKFGFGGRKRLQKQNDATSSADMSSYKSPSSGFKGKGRGGANKGASRPGKSKRAAARGRS